MGIPPAPGINLSLTSATPTSFDVDDLKAQLTNIGLDCAQINDENLSQYITEVTSQLQEGTIEAYSIQAPAGTLGKASVTSTVAAEPEVGSVAAAIGAYEEAATGNWTESDSAQGYSFNLGVIQYGDHFTWLVQNQQGFQGTTSNPPAYTGNFPNAQAIMNLFVNVGVTASSTLVKGIDKDAMTATFTNVIQPLADADLKNYNQPGSRTIYLVENYNTSTGYADAVGVLTVAWSLQISDWQRKTKDGGDTHPTVLTVSAWSVLYSDVNVLCRDYSAVVTQFGLINAPGCRTA